MTERITISLPDDIVKQINSRCIKRRSNNGKPTSFSKMVAILLKEVLNK